MQTFPAADTNRAACGMPAGLLCLKRRLVLSLCFWILLLYLNTGAKFGLPLPDFLAGGTLPYALAQLVLVLPIVWFNRSFFADAVRELRARTLGAGLPVALGAGAALVYSVCGIGMIGSGATDTVLLFDTAAGLLTLAAAGRLLQARAMEKAASAQRELEALMPQTACILRDRKQVTVPACDVAAGDIVLLRPGETIPADAAVMEGESAVNGSALTGNSAPVKKAKGDTVYAASVNGDGALICRAVRAGGDTALAQTVRLLRGTAAGASPLGQKAERVSGILVSAAVGIACLAVIVWLLLGQSFAFALARGISVLAVCCPCALGLAVSAAVTAGSGVGAKHGILFRSAASLQTVGSTDAAVLDKNGTVTTGEPEVTAITGTRSVPAKFLLGMAAGLESQSSDPLAKAVLRKAAAERIRVSAVKDFSVVPGQGLTGKLAGKIMAGGSAEFIATQCELTPDLREAGDKLAADGVAPLYFSLDGHPAGLIGISDAVKPGSKQAIDAMKALGLEVILLTEDRRGSAERLGTLLGLDESHIAADVLPGGKADAVSRLQSAGRAALVGGADMDADALACADLGILIGPDAGAAADRADILLPRGDLAGVPAAVRLSRMVTANIRRSLFWVCVYNAVCIPLAAGILYPLGFLLSPAVAACAAFLATACAAAGALHLSGFDPDDAGHDAPAPKRAAPKQKTPVRGVQPPHGTGARSKKILRITGMVCPHCEATVKTALEALPGVTGAAVSQETGTAVVSMDADISDADLKAAVEAKDYTVTSITAP